MSVLGSRAATALLAAALAVSLPALLPVLAGLRLPGVDSGYEPEQPVAFSHRLHAGSLEIPCLYCHSGAERSRHAGIPPLSLCMNCHKNVPAPFAEVRAEYAAAAREGRKARRLVSSEIAKIYASLGLDDNLKPDPARQARPLAWKRVHNLPDFAYFDHRPHAAAGVACAACHGPVELMERVRQHSDLTMGWCVECHRERAAAPADGRRTSPASIDCARCHF